LPVQDSTCKETLSADSQRLVKSLSGGDLSRTAAAGAPAFSREGRGPSICAPYAALPPQGSTEGRLFSPFPRQYVNRRRVDNAIRLGLYTVDDATPTPPMLKTTSAPASAPGRSSARYPHSW